MDNPGTKCYFEGNLSRNQDGIDLSNEERHIEQFIHRLDVLLSLDRTQNSYRGVKVAGNKIKVEIETSQFNTLRSALDVATLKMTAVPFADGVANFHDSKLIQCPSQPAGAALSAAHSTWGDSEGAKTAPSTGPSTPRASTPAKTAPPVATSSREGFELAKPESGKGKPKRLRQRDRQAGKNANSHSAKRHDDMVSGGSASVDNKVDFGSAANLETARFHSISQSGDRENATGGAHPNSFQLLQRQAARHAASYPHDADAIAPAEGPPAVGQAKLFNTPSSPATQAKELVPDSSLTANEQEDKGFGIPTHGFIQGPQINHEVLDGTAVDDKESQLSSFQPSLEVMEASQTPAGTGAQAAALESEPAYGGHAQAVHQSTLSPPLLRDNDEAAEPGTAEDQLYSGQGRLYKRIGRDWLPYGLGVVKLTIIKGTPALTVHFSPEEDESESLAATVDGRVRPTMRLTPKGKVEVLFVAAETMTSTESLPFLLRVPNKQEGQNVLVVLENAYHAWKEAGAKLGWNTPHGSSSRKHRPTTYGKPETLPSSASPWAKSKPSVDVNSPFDDGRSIGRMKLAKQLHPKLYEGEVEALIRGLVEVLGEVRLKNFLIIGWGSLGESVGKALKQRGGEVFVWEVEECKRQEVKAAGTFFQERSMPRDVSKEGTGVEPEELGVLGAFVGGREGVDVRALCGRTAGIGRGVEDYALQIMKKEAARGLNAQESLTASLSSSSNTAVNGGERNEEGGDLFGNFGGGVGNLFGGGGGGGAGGDGRGVLSTMPWRGPQTLAKRSGDGGMSGGATGEW